MNTILTNDFAYCLSKELAAKFAVKISEDEWASIFARCIGVDILPSMCDWKVIRQDGIAWCAKIITNCQPHSVKHIDLEFNRLDVKNVHDEDPERIGALVLDIWNARFKNELSQFSDLRTAILIRNELLTEFSVMEIETKPFNPDDYTWDWNSKNNLEGYEKSTGLHRFTWQPHGSQFTHIPDLPSTRLKLRVKKPPMVSREYVLDEIKFDPAWIEIVE